MKDADYRVKLYPDGKYRWIYEVNLLRNPTVLFDVYKVLGMSIVILVVIALLIGLFSGDLSLSLLKGLGVGLLAATGVMLVLGALGYVFYALITGKKYIVLFTLDEHELVHKQMPATMKKARLIGELAILAGAVAGRPGVAGAGMLAASRDSLTSTLSDVKQVVPRRWMNTIKVNETLFKNRAYVCDEDFDFVLQFLREHCPNLKK
ncbi:MAG: hypothetical protein J5552_02445 [Prevotella sp.]|nr:hypothetical protein [Prevotella sp.]